MQAVTLPLILSLITTVISGLFAAMVLTRWRAAIKEGKQRPHLRAWGIGLSLYCLGAFSQVARVKGDWLIPLPPGITAHRRGPTGYTF